MLLLKAVCTLTLVSVAASIESTTKTKDTKVTSYDPGELLAKIFKPNTTISSRQRGYGLVFEDQLDPQTSSDDHGQYGLITFEDSQKLKFKDDSQNENSNQPLRFENDNFQNFDGFDKPLKDQRPIRDQVTFQDDNTIVQGNKKKRRRRRKPKKVLQNYQGVPNYHLQGVSGGPGFPQPGFGGNTYPTNPGFGLNPAIPGLVPFRRRRRPRPSLTSDALTAVTGALTSIALYDDYQCVPRLLCEAAGGGSLGSNGVLNSIAAIQPLLTLLSAYNGISASSLFVFGRAVFLGMTSHGNTGTCRYAYPQCPTDPEQLIHYLNNHNGGFFRFFNAPQPNQDLEQFYNHLGQNGPSDFGQGFGQNGFNLGQDYGQNQQLQQGYGLYQNQLSGQGFQSNHIGNQRPNAYGQNYGSNYDYNTYGSNNVRFKDSNAKIEKRIQNKPVKDDDNSFDDNFDNKFQFPGERDPNIYNNDQANYDFDDEDNNKDSNNLKFPEESQKYDDKRDITRKSKSILFPENQYNHNAYSNKNYLNTNTLNNFNKGQYYPIYYNKVTTRRPYYQNNYYQNDNTYKPTTATPFNENDYYYDHKHNFYVKKTQEQDNNNNNYNKYHNQLNSNYYYNKEHNKVNYNNYINNRFRDEGTQTVYIVRGHGDPNNPEIVNVRPGETIH